VIIFFDANVIIYQVEGAEPFHQHVRDILQQLLRRHDAACFAVSRLSMLECLVKPVREQDTQRIARYRDFFSATDLTIVELDAQVLETALLLRAHHGLRTPDAIQAASALSLKSRFTFLTGDRNFTTIPGFPVQLID